MSTHSQPQELGIYIHLPFCKVKCSYCHFFTFAGKLAKSPAYFRALETEINAYAQQIGDREVSTIYIGGGTPSLVDAVYIEQLLAAIKLSYKLSKDVEITIEANPESITPEKLDTYLKAGVNRISIGVQAWQNHILKYMNRLYTIEQFQEKLALVKESGFKNINLDLIFGIPNQTFAEWQESVRGVISSDATHLSCYSLELDNNSHFGNLYAAGKFKPADPDLDREMYKYVVEAMTKAGYNRYEMSNFALPGFECRHNLNFWLKKEYLGFGAAAHSYFSGQHFHNIYSIEQYTAMQLTAKSTVEVDSKPDEAQQMFEFLYLGLRLPQGVGLEKFAQVFGKRLELLYSAQISSAVLGETLLLDQSHLKLTPKGFDVYNSVLAEFMPE